MSRKPEPTSVTMQSGAAALDLIRGITVSLENSPNAAEAAHVSASLSDLGSIVRRLQTSLEELQLENRDLKRQLQAAVDLKAARKHLRYETNVYWDYDDVGVRVDGPFCPNCFDEGYVRRLKPGGASGTYRCAHHKALFHTGLAGTAVRTAGA